MMKFWYCVFQNINDWLRNDAIENIDKTQLILLTMAMAFCTDGLVEKLLEKEAIEEAQLKYLNMLHRYLKDKHPNSSRSKLAQGMFIIAEAQEAHEIQTNRLRIWCQITLIFLFSEKWILFDCLFSEKKLRIFVCLFTFLRNFGN